MARRSENRTGAYFLYVRTGSAATTQPVAMHRPSVPRKNQNLTFVRLLAERTGLEPAASGVTGRRYNRLNYRSRNLQFSTVGGVGIEPTALAL